MASMGCNIERFAGGGVPCFKISGRVHHKISTNVNLEGGVQANLRKTQVNLKQSYSMFPVPTRGKKTRTPAHERCRKSDAAEQRCERHDSCAQAMVRRRCALASRPKCRMRTKPRGSIGYTQTVIFCMPKKRGPCRIRPVFTNSEVDRENSDNRSRSRLAQTPMN